MGLRRLYSVPRSSLRSSVHHAAVSVRADVARERARARWASVRGSERAFSGGEERVRGDAPLVAISSTWPLIIPSSTLLLTCASSVPSPLPSRSASLHAAPNSASPLSPSSLNASTTLLRYAPASPSISRARRSPFAAKCAAVASRKGATTRAWNAVEGARVRSRRRKERREERGIEVPLRSRAMRSRVDEVTREEMVESERTECWKRSRPRSLRVRRAGVSDQERRGGGSAVPDGEERRRLEHEGAVEVEQDAPDEEYLPRETLCLVIKLGNPPLARLGVVRPALSCAHTDRGRRRGLRGEFPAQVARGAFDFEPDAVVQLLSVLAALVHDVLCEGVQGLEGLWGGEWGPREDGARGAGEGGEWVGARRGRLVGLGASRQEGLFRGREVEGADFGAVDARRQSEPARQGWGGRWGGRGCGCGWVVELCHFGGG